MNVAYWGAVYHNNSIGVKFEEKDKLKHFFISSAFGAAAKQYTNSNQKALALALVPGVLKELYDSKSSSGTGWSNKDMVVNIAGAMSGIYFRDVFVQKVNHQIVIGINKEF